MHKPKGPLFHSHIITKTAECTVTCSGLLLQQAFDGSTQHKWLDFGGANKGVTWLEYRRLPSQPATTVTRYSLTSAEDEPSRDPCSFVLEGRVKCPLTSGTHGISPLAGIEGSQWELNNHGSEQSRRFPARDELGMCKAMPLRGSDCAVLQEIAVAQS